MNSFTLSGPTKAPSTSEACGSKTTSSAYPIQSPFHVASIEGLGALEKVVHVLLRHRPRIIQRCGKTGRVAPTLLLSRAGERERCRQIRPRLLLVSTTRSSRA